MLRCSQEADPIECLRRQVLGQKTPPSRRSKLSVEEYCKPGATKQECENAMRSMVADVSRVHRLKKRFAPNWQLCPHFMDRVRCFENYLSIWMAVVMENQGKRNFGPGKRSASVMPGKVDVCPPGFDQVKCFEGHVGVFLTMLQSMRSGLHGQFGSGGGNSMGNRNLVKISNRLVGKRNNDNSNSGFCNEGESEKQCHLRYLRVMLNFHPKFRNIVCNGYNEEDCLNMLLDNLKRRML